MVTRKPEARHVVIDGQHYAEIDGERYPLKRINGAWCFSEKDVMAIAERHAPPEVQDSIAKHIRQALAAHGGGSERLQ